MEMPTDLERLLFNGLHSPVGGKTQTIRTNGLLPEAAADSCSHDAVCASAMQREGKQSGFKGERSVVVQPSACDTNKAPPTTIADLLPDLLALVLTFLHIKKCLRSTDLVSKAFHRASKHPLHWDEDEPCRLSIGCQVAEAVKFCTKHGCVPNLYVVLQRLPRASFRVLPRLNTLHKLSLRGVEPCNVSSASVWLSSLNQLESLSVNGTFDTFVFPAMPRLRKVELGSDPLHTIMNMDATHLPLLSSLLINSESNLQSSAFPESLHHLTLNAASCSTQVLASIAKLPNLQFLRGNRSGDVLSQRDLRFTFTLTTLVMFFETTSQAQENLRHCINLAMMIVDSSRMSAADVEIFAACPSLTELVIHSFDDDPYPDMSPFRHSASLKRLCVYELPSSSLQHFALPSLMCLALCHNARNNNNNNISLAPLSSCVNLIALDVDGLLLEQDAQVIAGLTKLEKLHVMVSSEACFTHICRPQRLKVLIVETVSEQTLVGPIALQALAGLAPTIEKLALPYSVDMQATVLGVCKLESLYYLCSLSCLTRQQVSLLRSSLPRLRKVIHGEWDDYLYRSVWLDSCVFVLPF